MMKMELVSFNISNLLQEESLQFVLYLVLKLLLCVVKKVWSTASATMGTGRLNVK